MKKLLYTTIIFSTMLVSCRENLEPAMDPDPPLEVPERTRIKTETGSSSVTTYVYDDLGRQVLYYSSNGFKRETTYAQHEIKQISFNAEGTPTIIYTHVLNDRGLVISSDRSDVPGASYLYEYNDADQVVKYTSITPTGIFEGISTYADGNEETVVYKRDGALAYTYRYYYYTDIPNGLNSDDWGESFFGQRNKNLMKSWVGIGKDGKVFTTYSYTYTFDDKGRVETMNQIHDGSTTTQTYSYY